VPKFSYRPEDNELVIILQTDSEQLKVNTKHFHVTKTKVGNCIEIQSYFIATDGQEKLITPFIGPLSTIKNELSGRKLRVKQGYRFNHRYTL